MTNESAAIVQTVFGYAIREINALETRIVKSEDDADAMLWEQAEQVVAQLEAGLSQRQLAAQWINARTGEPYSHTHVQIVERVFRGKFTCQPRPRFREAYNEIANAPPKGVVHVSHNSGNNEWYTPADYIEAEREVLGGIDLDPASSTEANAVVHAARFFSQAEDGLAQPWHGCVWLNPPYAKPLIAHFAEKFAASVERGDVSAAVVLVNNATETEWFQTLAHAADAFCFPKKRIPFRTPDRDHTATGLQGQAML
jgi:phage N-6-adenine-methyltransferase